MVREFSANYIDRSHRGNQILEQIARLQEMPTLGVLSLSIFLSTWTASSLFVEVFDALNRIYGVREHRPWWRLRLLAIMLVICQCVLIFGSLLTIVFWPQIMLWAGLSDAETSTLSLLKWFLMFCLMMLSFGLTYQFGPAVKQNKKWVSPGALFGTVVFLLASYGFRVYVQYYANYSNAYGPLGGVMMLLLWLYISSLVLLMGAEMNKLAQIATHKDD
ncbi:MAG: YihY/virulence factor BrkB family protein, partial [Candidatus Obscuribacterales bacterium]|nr:YihY/virulence factor BrkB family protein [Candidatus Obscuribacterales bacterium]